jgi:hypothetical protein|tara:strand:- start:357 stop:635 length:279 start_codon:yes stop_codon:yes gene_type:complete
MNKEQRAKRVIARGEHSNHCHVITGNVEITDGEILVKDDSARIRHLMETNWLGGEEVWTKEHTDIPLEVGTYRYIQQLEYHPYEDEIRAVQD